MFILYLTASILIAHGLGHSLGFLAGWTSIPAGFRDQPWLFSSGVRYTGWAGRIFGLLWLAAAGLFLVSGFGLIFQTCTWQIWALGGALVSLLAILPWWRTVNPAPKHLATLVDLLVLLALVLPWGGLVLITC